MYCWSWLGPRPQSLSRLQYPLYRCLDDREVCILRYSLVDLSPLGGLSGGYPAPSSTSIRRFGSNSTSCPAGGFSQSSPVARLSRFSKRTSGSVLSADERPVVGECPWGGTQSVKQRAPDPHWSTVASVLQWSLLLTGVCPWTSDRQGLGCWWGHPHPFHLGVLIPKARFLMPHSN